MGTSTRRAGLKSDCRINRANKMFRRNLTERAWRIRAITVIYQMALDICMATT